MNGRSPVQIAVGIVSLVVAAVCGLLLAYLGYHFLNNTITDRFRAADGVCMLASVAIFGGIATVCLFVAHTMLKRPRV